MWDRLFHPSVYWLVLELWAALALCTCAALLLVPAPYGRHWRRGWGPAVPARWAWVVMEAPASLTVAALFAAGRPAGAPALALFGLWQIHYLYRGFLYPFLLPRSARPAPAAIAALGAVFHVLNGYLQGGWLFFTGPGYPPDWLASARFLGGSALFFAGLAVNVQSDGILRGLRRAGGSGYKTPQGGLFRWISCPNYLGEMVEWMGWALASWSPAGAVFALWTIANLAPRARSHHCWYCENLPDYPPGRRALLPGIW